MRRSSRVIVPSTRTGPPRPPGWLTRRLGGPLLRRFVRRQDGATVVEFGLVLLPFLSILVMIMETSLFFFAQQTLETAVADSARLIMTGQAQSAKYDAAQFKTAVCGRIVALFDCANGLYVDVSKYSNFSSIGTSVAVDADGKPVTQYQPGAKGEVVVVRLIYRWPITTPLAQLYLAEPSSTSRMLVATAAFRNEPF
jgi:Flp pilus assembly protein TadG